MYIIIVVHVGKTIAGTTDSPTDVTHNPQPTEEDIRFILKEIKDYLSPDLSGNYYVIDTCMMLDSVSTLFVFVSS